MDLKLRRKYEELVERQLALDKEYESLIRESLDSPNQEVPYILLPPRPPRSIVIEPGCPLAQPHSARIELITLAGQRSTGLKKIQDFTSEAESLIIIDPYLFSGASASADSIARDFKRSARIGKQWLKRIHCIYDPGQATQAVKQKIKKTAREGGVNYTESHTTDIHDRVWIADRNRALVVGTSLNGIGGRVSFLLPLPKGDLDALLEFLDNRGLSRSS